MGRQDLWDGSTFLNFISRRVVNQQLVRNGFADTQDFFDRF